MESRIEMMELRKDQVEREAEKVGAINQRLWNAIENLEEMERGLVQGIQMRQFRMVEWRVGVQLTEGLGCN